METTNSVGRHKRRLAMSSYYVESHHPYGVKPEGNAFLASVDLLNVRLNGLGRLKCLNDEVLLEILSYFNGPEIVKLIYTSKTLYVYCHYTDIWRDIMLREWENNAQSYPIKYCYTWKDTYVSSYCERNNIAKPKIPHQPLIVDGIYSNLLYRSWACHECNYEKSCQGFWTNDDVPHIEADKLTIEEFIANYETQNRPVVIKDCINDWSALRTWTKDYLTSQCGDNKFRATSSTAPIAASFTMEEYFSYAHQSKEEVPYYLFERNYDNMAKALKSDYYVPRYFNAEDYNNQNHATDLFSLFGSRRPDYKWLIIGPKKSGSIFHIDPNQTNAWNAAIKGRKKWIFYPPGRNPPGVLTSADLGDVTVPLSTGEWLLSFWKYHLEARNDINPTNRPLETILHPGEVIFVPHSWWHCVINLDDSIALTHNYVSTSNLSDCLHFLREKTDQISGVRDRNTIDNTVQPDEMYPLFIQELKSNTTINKSILDDAIARSYQSANDNKNTTDAREPSNDFNKRKRKLLDKPLKDNVKSAVDDEPFVFNFDF